MKISTRNSAVPLTIFLLSLSMGVLQLVLAYFSGVFSDANDATITRFGYLRTFHWSFVYAAIVPFILSSSIPVVLVLLQKTSQSGNYWRMTILLGFGIAFASFTSIKEIWQSLTACSTPQTIFIQWNCMSDQRATYGGLSYHRSTHFALIYICYLHYFLVYLFGSTAVLGVTWYFWRIVRKNLAALKFKDVDMHLLFSQRIIVMCYLIYLVCLRSSKVSMHLQAKGQMIPITNPLEYIKIANPYVDAISPNLLITLLLGIFWSIVLIVTHALAWQGEHPKRYTSVVAILGPIAGGLELMGSGTRLCIGACLIAIALPPPGFIFLTFTILILIGLKQLKEGIKRE